MNKTKTIGVLTSGGDAPGMNAAVRSVARSALARGMKVIGIRRGYNGLIHKDYFEMCALSVSDIIHKGGTVLYTARSPEFRTHEGKLKALETVKELGIDGIVTIGGDGTYMGAKMFSEMGVPCVGIPATIDNDIACTDYSIGFDTAINTAVEMVDKLRDTAHSHERCTIVEVMGRDSGSLAIRCAIAVGAFAVIVPEVKYDFQRDIIENLIKLKAAGKKHAIIVVAEGMGLDMRKVSKEIEDKTGLEARWTVLGHVQRGGSPNIWDRVMASEMGCYAVSLLAEGIGNRVVAYKNSKVVDYDIAEGLAMTKPPRVDLLRLIGEIGL